VSHLASILTMILALYALATSVFLISENRRPQSTLAWMLVLFFAPGVGLLIYFLFGRSRKAFSNRRNLLQHDLQAHKSPLLAPLLSRQDATIVRLGREIASGSRVMMLVRRNSYSVLTTRNRVEIQQNAAAFYRSLIEDMKAAQRSIHHQYYIWRGDAFARELKDILTAKAKAGVEVRVLYDPLGSHADLTRSYVREMESAGARMAPTSPLYRLHTISYRNHRKISVIDGAIGYTGGMNIGSEHLDGGKGFSAWRDTQLRMVGESASVLQAVFMVDWYNATRENLFSGVRGADDLSDRDEAPVQIVTSGPDSEWAAIRQLYASMIASARKHVFLQSPFFIPDATIAEALKLAALTGVDVRLMVSARASGNRIPAWATNTYLADIVAAGARVFLYDKGYLHAKTISIDSEICSIGSANIDIRSFGINYEINAVLYDEHLTRQLESAFERDLADCSEFRLSAYRERNAAIRFRDSVARLLSPLL
jgi:cardiolipin synthase